MQPEVHLGVDAAVLEQLADVPGQVGVVERVGVDGLEASVLRLEGGLDVGLPLRRHAQPRPGAQRGGGGLLPAAEGGVDAGGDAQHDRRRELGAGRIGPEERAQPGVHEAVDEAGLEGVRRYADLSEGPAQPGGHGVLHEPLADGRGAAGEVGSVEGPAARSRWGEDVVRHRSPFVPAGDCGSPAPRRAGRARGRVRGAADRTGVLGRGAAPARRTAGAAESGGPVEPLAVLGRAGSRRGGRQVEQTGWLAQRADDGAGPDHGGQRG